MSCGVAPDYSDCALSCSYNTQGGLFYTIEELFDYCAVGPVGYANTACVKYFLTDCRVYDPLSSSSSAEVTFDWEKAKQGFSDSFEFFFMVFVAFCLVRMLSFISR